MSDITERLAEIEARVEAADDGPWRVRGSQVDPSWKWAAGVESTSLDPGEVDTTIAEVVDAPDAEFIAHARTDVPALLAVVKGVLALADEMNAASDREAEMADRYGGYHAGARSARMEAETRLRAVIREAVAALEEGDR